MNERVKTLHEWVKSGGQRAGRRSLGAAEEATIQTVISNPALSLPMREALRLKLFLESERITVRPEERIVGLRTLRDFPLVYRPGEISALQAGHHVHEQGRVCNIACDYQGVIAEGLLGRRARAEASLAAGRGDAEFLKAAMACIDAVIAFSDRWADGLRQIDQAEAGEALSQAIRHGAKTFRDGLQMFRMLHMALWAAGNYHNTVGRFDQYMLPYLQADLRAGRLTEESALDLLTEFFISFNRDSDLYTGMQQGDNGQSMMLGGCDRTGKDAYNMLTEMCLSASLETGMIDPKINLRVNSKTPIEVFERATRLTRQGLGFPQYANDDVVIPGLTALGYALEDARDYVVAACWEFIIPGVGMDIPNIGAISLAGVVDRVLREDLENAGTFDGLTEILRARLRREAESLARTFAPLWMASAPYQSVLMTNSLDEGRDIGQGAKYNNYGIHGTGFADAVDQLAAVQKYVYEEKSLTPARLLAALQSGFQGEEALERHLREDAPKLGRDAEAESIADLLIDAFADALDGLVNERGGIYRAGTGSAMYYLWHAKELGALANGHVPGEPLSANFSPSLLLSDAGPLSVLQAFARPHVQRVINGGPLTLELHDTVFKQEEGLKKVAQLVQSFILLGGHQLQLNAVNRDALLAAQKDPDAYRGLIVRVWGWSGHFVQLDRPYQDQIIARTSYGV